MPGRDTERMRTALRGWLENGDALTAVTPLSTGHSNETYLLEGLDRILRMPPSEEQGLLPPYDMACQHAVLAAVGAITKGPPVPRVFELCRDPAVLGDAFFVMERLDGEAFEFEVPDWLAAAEPGERDHMCRQWLDALAGLHNAPPEAMPGPRVTLAEEIGHWRDLARTAQDAPASLHAMLDELHADPPPVSGPPAPVHGDSKIGNCLWDGTRLTALLDWEMAGVGEPLTDIGYLCQFYDQGEQGFANAGIGLEGWWSRAQVIEHWQAATSRQAAQLHRYEALAMCKVSAIIAYGFHLFQSRKIRDPRFEGWGQVVPGYVAMAEARIAG